MIRFSFVFAALVASGCAEIGESAPTGHTPGSPTTLADQLQTPVTASLHPTAAGGSEAAIRARAGSGKAQAFELSITGGSVDVQFVGGELVLRELSIEVDDLELPAEVVPRDGARLTGVGLALEAAVGAVPAILDDEVMVAEIVASADIHWTMIKDGVEFPLVTLELDDLHLVVTVSHVDGAPVVRISGGQDGSLWSWLDHFELADLELSLVATRGPVVE
jgi:hypothetical protein